MTRMMGTGLLLLCSALTQPVLSQQMAPAAASVAYERARDAAERLEPSATAQAKVAAYVAAMDAADRAGNVEKTLEWGERVLVLEPGNRFAQMRVSSWLPEQLPSDEAAKTATLTRAMDLANKAHNQTEAYYKGPKPADVTAEEWAEQKRILEARVHATLGTIHLIRKEYDDSVFMYEYVVELTPEDGLSQYRLGAAYAGQTAEAEEFAGDMRQDEARAPADRSEAAQSQLTKERAVAEEDYVEKRDKAIESLARAVALGRPSAQQARPELERLYRTKNNNLLTGLDALINTKKAELDVQ